MSFFRRNRAMASKTMLHGVFIHSVTAIAVAIFASRVSAAEPVTSANTSHDIGEKAFIPIGGIEQWTTIQRRSRNNPVVPESSVANTIASIENALATATVHADSEVAVAR